MSAAPSVSDVSALLGADVDEAQCAAILSATSAFVSQYLRGEGTGDDWNDAARAVVITASARFLKNPSGANTTQETAGPFTNQVTFAAPASFSALEWNILNTLRARTNRPKE